MPHRSEILKPVTEGVLQPAIEVKQSPINVERFCGNHQMLDWYEQSQHSGLEGAWAGVRRVLLGMHGSSGRGDQK
jgi:hypothetical protein